MTPPDRAECVHSCGKLGDVHIFPFVLRLLLEAWRNGQTLAATARDVQLQLREVQRLTTELQLEWGDVLDKLLAREDRQRKRDRSRVAETVGAEQPVDPQQLNLLQPQKRLLGRR